MAMWLLFTRVCLALAFALLAPAPVPDSLAATSKGCCPCVVEHQKSCPGCPDPTGQCSAQPLPLVLIASESTRFCFEMPRAGYSPVHAVFGSRSERPLLPPPKVA